MAKTSGGKKGRSAKTGRFITVKKAVKTVVREATKRKPGNPPNTTKG